MTRFRKFGVACLGLIGLMLWLIGCGKNDQPQQARIILTADIRGRLVPCGCFTGQLGGMTRLYTALNEMSQQAGIRVDAGDAISGHQDYEIIQYQHILQAFNQMKFDALNLGAREASIPAATLLRLEQETAAPLISANLINTETGQALLPTHINKSIGQNTVTIVGIVDHESVDMDQLGAGLQLVEPEIALRALLPKLRKQADIIVLLAFAKEARLRELADKFYEADFILGGDVTQPSGHTRRINQSQVFYVANESRTIGQIDFNIQPRENIQRPEISIINAQPRLLYEDIPEAEAITQLAHAYRKRIRNTTLDIDRFDSSTENLIPGVRAVAQYMGSQTCAACHQEESLVWQKTGHAHAWSTLQRQDADADPKCITCHSVGFGKPSGYRREFKHEKLVNVGCESCHGPGSTHVAERSSGQAVTFHFRTLTEADCRSCHYGEFSRPFEWSEFWPEVAHGPQAKQTN